MAEKIKYYDAILLKTKTATQWTQQNPILKAGELGLESDTLRLKLGNGSGRWTTLSYMDAELRSRIENIEDALKSLAELLSSLIDNKREIGKDDAEKIERLQILEKTNAALVEMISSAIDNKRKK